LLCNFSQIYPMDRGTNYAVRDGDAMARRIMADLGAQPAQAAAGDAQSVAASAAA
jgi:hypothetical protein